MRSLPPAPAVTLIAMQLYKRDRPDHMQPAESCSCGRQRVRAQCRQAPGAACAAGWQAQSPCRQRGCPQLACRPRQARLEAREARSRSEGGVGAENRGGGGAAGGPSLHGGSGLSGRVSSSSAGGSRLGRGHRALRLPSAAAQRAGLRGGRAQGRTAWLLLAVFGASALMADAVLPPGLR